MSTVVAPASAGSGVEKRYLLTLAAMGVVYGDIGTSPLYALRECFYGPRAMAPTTPNILGILSLIFLALVVVISIKYLVFVLRADNRGEGGILALMELIHQCRGTRASRFVIPVSLFGAALLYGDGMITPAISVLSAMEGLEVATPALEPYVLPITIGVLIALFMIQSRGTAAIGRLFGPIVLLWFLILGVLGLLQILSEPSVLAALNPIHGINFFVRNGWEGFLILGTVFLVVTGGEAIYADMGHFGAEPIRFGWFAIALPSLLLNYFGQGALLIHHPEAAANPFFNLAPRALLWVLIPIATAATIIASQAVISGAFSLSRQAVQLGYCPRVQIEHTSAEQIGQIYLPAVNWALMLATIALVISFGSSSNLAAAYGIAVTSTMVITTLLLFLVARYIWHWKLFTRIVVFGLLLIVDLAFFGANIVKIPSGGWFPLLVGASILVLMTTWNRGRAVLRSRLDERMIPLPDFLKTLHNEPFTRVPGTAVFMVGTPDVVPPSLTHNLKANKVLHEQVIILSVLTTDEPFVPVAERAEVTDHGSGIYSIHLRYGFMQNSHVPRALGRLRVPHVDPDHTTYFLGRENIVRAKRPSGLSGWREHLFAFMSRNALPATAFFRIPSEKVFEVGVQVDL